MQGAARICRGAILASAALLVLAGCSNGNNNKKNSATTQAQPSASSAAASVVARTGTPVAATRSPSPSPVARTATPATTARTATPVTAARTGTPTGLPSQAGTATTGVAPADASLQKTLADAALKENDLPAGFTMQGTPDTSASLPGEVAVYTATFTNFSKLPSVQAVIIGLGGYRDAAGASNDFKTLEQQIADSSGSDFKLTPEPNGPKLGDEAKSFKMSGVSSGIPLGGYAILWRRGRISSAVVLVGTPDIQSIGDVTPLAQKQDDKLKAAGQ